MKAEAMVAAGDHSMTVEEAVKFINHPQFAFLDVRPPQERIHLAFPLAGRRRGSCPGLLRPAGASKTMITYSPRTRCDEGR